MSNQVLFSETQKFRQWWVWLILLLVVGLVAFVAIVVVGEESSEDKTMPMPMIILVSTGLFILVPTVLLFFNMKLETHIKDEGLNVRFFPFHMTFKEYKWDSISKSYVRQYNPIGEYGGWGLRIGPAGKAFNVSGDKGLQLEFVDNKKLLIGTNKPDELGEVLTRIGQLKG